MHHRLEVSCPKWSRHFELVAAARTVTGVELRAADFFRARATVSAANRAPNANRITGPKLFAAASPTKCKPWIDDSNADERSGVPSTVLRFERIAGLKKVSRSMSTL